MIITNDDRLVSEMPKAPHRHFIISENNKIKSERREMFYKSFKNVRPN